MGKMSSKAKKHAKPHKDEEFSQEDPKVSHESNATNVKDKSENTNKKPKNSRQSVRDMIEDRFIDFENDAEDEEALQKNWLYQDMKSKVNGGVSCTTKGYFAVILQNKGRYSECIFWWESIHKQHSSQNHTVRFTEQEIKNGRKVHISMKLFLNFLTNCQDEKMLQSYPVYKQMKTDFRLFDCSSGLKVAEKLGAQGFKKEAQFWFDRLRNKRLKSTNPDERHGQIAPEVMIPKLIEKSYDDFCKIRDKEYLEELEEFDIILKNSSTEVDLKDHPLYQAMKDDIDYWGKPSKCIIGQKLKDAQFYKESIFWLEKAAVGMDTKDCFTIDHLDQNILDCLISVFHFFQDDANFMDYGYENLRFFRTSPTFLKNSDFSDEGDFFLEMSEAAKRVGRFDLAYVSCERRWGYLKFVKKIKLDEVDTELSLLPYDATIDLLETAVRSEDDFLALNILQQFKYANLNSDNPKDLDTDYYDNLYEDLEKKLQKETDPEEFEKLRDSQRNLAEILFRIAEIARLKSECIDTFTPDCRKFWAIKAAVLFLKVAKKVDQELDFSVLDRIILRYVMIVCLFTQFRAVDNFLDSIDGIVDHDCDRKPDVYYFLQAEKQFGKRRVILQFINKVLDDMSQDQEKKDRYIHYKNSLFINDYFKCLSLAY